MSLLLKGGVTRLSGLEIDADKDWQAREVTNLKAVAGAMAHGDIPFRGAGVLEKLGADAGSGYSFLRSRGPGLAPVWQDIEALIRYMTGALNRATAADLAVPTPGVSSSAAAAPGGAASSLRSLPVPEPSIGLQAQSGPGGGVTATPTLGMPEPAVSRAAQAGNPLGGAVADDGGVQTDETAQANDDTASDMTLLPAGPAVDDAYYFGLASMWDFLRLNIGTAGGGTWTITWEYWDGVAWSALADVDDGTGGLRNAGWNDVTFTRPGDWATADVGGIAGLYWVRARVSAYTSIAAQPLGTRVFCYVAA